MATRRDLEDVREAYRVSPEAGEAKVTELQGRIPPDAVDWADAILGLFALASGGGAAAYARHLRHQIHLERDARRKEQGEPVHKELA